MLKYLVKSLGLCAQITSIVEAIGLAKCFEHAVLSAYPRWVQAKGVLMDAPWLLLALLAFLAGISSFGTRCIWLCEFLTHEATIATLTLACYSVLVFEIVLVALPTLCEDPAFLELINAAAYHFYGAPVGAGGFDVWESGPEPCEHTHHDLSGDVGVLALPSPPPSPPPPSPPVRDDMLNFAGFVAGAIAIPFMLSCRLVQMLAINCLPGTLAKVLSSVAWLSSRAFALTHVILASHIGPIVWVVAPPAVLLCPLVLMMLLFVLFSIKFFWTTSLYAVFGTPLLRRNTAMNRAHPRDTETEFEPLPLLIMAIAVYSEDLKTVAEPTLKELDKSRRMYEAAGGKAVLLIMDDGLKAGISRVSDTDDLLNERRALFRNYRAIWVARPKHGTTWDDMARVFERTREGLFKKAGNLNGGLTLVRKLIDQCLAKTPRTAAAVRELLHGIQDDRIFAGYEVGADDTALRPLCQLRQDEVEHSILMIFDADSKTPDDCDALSHVAREFAAARAEGNPIAYAQMRMSCFHDGEHDYFTKFNQVWTDGLFTESIAPMCAGGAAPPIVGHHLAVDFNVHHKLADSEPAACFGGLQYFSEAHTGEDFILMIHLLADGAKGVYVSYMHGWKEGGSEDVHTEYMIWRKHLNSTLEICFTPFFGRKTEQHPNAFLTHADGTPGWLFGGILTKGVIAAPIAKYLSTLHSSSAPWYSRLGTLAYMGTHPAIASAPLMSLLLIVWIRYESARDYIVSPLQVLEYVVFVFTLCGAVSTQIIKRCRLVHTHAGSKLVLHNSITAELLNFGVQKFIFFAGLPVHLLPVLIKHFLGYKNHFGASHAAADTDDCTATVCERLLALKIRYREQLVTMTVGLLLFCALRHVGLFVGAPEESTVLFWLLAPLAGPILLDANLMKEVHDWLFCTKLHAQSARYELQPQRQPPTLTSVVIDSGLHYKGITKPYLPGEKAAGKRAMQPGAQAAGKDPMQGESSGSRHAFRKHPSHAPPKIVRIREARIREAERVQRQWVLAEEDASLHV